MINAHDVPAVAPDEVLARYILQRKHIRRSNGTVRPDAFVPHPYFNLSVSRHLLATEAELWSLGRQVAIVTGKTLYGRADILTEDCLNENLAVTAAPIADSPNHAEVSDWPKDYDEQKAIALELAANAKFVDSPV